MFYILKKYICMVNFSKDSSTPNFIKLSVSRVTMLLMYIQTDDWTQSS